MRAESPLLVSRSPYEIGAKNRKRALGYVIAVRRVAVAGKLSARSSGVRLRHHPAVAATLAIFVGGVGEGLVSDNLAERSSSRERTEPATRQLPSVQFGRRLCVALRGRSASPGAEELSKPGMNDQRTAINNCRAHS